METNLCPHRNQCVQALNDWLRCLAPGRSWRCWWWCTLLRVLKTKKCISFKVQNRTRLITMGSRNAHKPRTETSVKPRVTHQPGRFQWVKTSWLLMQMRVAYPLGCCSSCILATQFHPYHAHLMELDKEEFALQQPCAAFALLCYLLTGLEWAEVWLGPHLQITQISIYMQVFCSVVVSLSLCHHRA